MAPDHDRRFGVPALLDAIQELSLARDERAVQHAVRRSARRLVRADGASLALRDGALCRYVVEDGIGPGWTGRRLKLGSCLSGWCMTHGRPVASADVRADGGLPVAQYRSGPVRSVLVVPVRTGDPIGAIAAYWLTPHRPGPDEVRTLQALADSASGALDNAALRSELETRVRDRTARLEELNARLEKEIFERKRAEEEVRQLSLVDELTGLYNRRGFMLLAGRELKSLQRTGRRALLLYIDLDGLKQANDLRGHEAGDRLLVQAAGVLRSVSRASDVAGRIGGDEFAVFMTLGYDHPPVHLIVERFLQAARRAGVRWSVGATASPPGRTVLLEDLLAGADEAMYRGRRARRINSAPPGIRAAG
ncbi:MAG TPA: diguanylate cyclase [Acidimicrobiales bacterium]|nr:diguanylate cyclase [Acidimicrobiales bacterium]